jgi:hypothetical protein
MENDIRCIACGSLGEVESTGICSPCESAIADHESYRASLEGDSSWFEDEQDLEDYASQWDDDPNPYHGDYSEC